MIKTQAPSFKEFCVKVIVVGVIITRTFLVEIEPQNPSPMENLKDYVFVFA
jgi:hypothetical protein